MKPQLLDIDDKEYFALPSIDQSQLKQFLHNPADWGWNRLHPEDGKTTAAMSFGTAFHAYLLGTSNVVSLPEGETLRKKANLQWKQEQEEQGNIVVSHDDMNLLKRMKSGIENRDEYMSQIENGLKEQCIQWQDRRTGLILKAKPDLIPAGNDHLVDLKTAASAQADDFAREALKWGYHIQAEFYRWAVAQISPDKLNRTRREATQMQFWVFEKTGACDWQPFSIGKDSPIAESARTSIRQALNKLAEYVELGEKAGLGKGLDAAAHYALTHGYAKVCEEVQFTDWQLKQAENLL